MQANGITCGSRVANSNVTTVSSASQGELIESVVCICGVTYTIAANLL